ncbi:MAG TPA: nucleoside triphosphate pyrophosphohydrolase [Chloroflexota bacterium]|nr:nucleoside triphosphate pyrophosphohydrolase [Chloroflexota bacterium]
MEGPLQVIPAAALLEPLTLGMSPAYLVNPALRLLVTGVSDAAALRAALDQVYPAGHPVRETPDGWVVEPLPPLDHGSYLGAMEYITGRLRAPNGCPWDREQDHKSIRSYLLEEAYETLDALDSGDRGKLAEELGDLLMQVLLHAEIARQSGEFDLRDVVLGISSKLVRRHPHVFGDVVAESAGQVLANWDEIKKAERPPDQSILASVASAMPALAYAQEVSERAARQGFEWPDIQGVVDKIREEIQELAEAATPEEVVDEFGDLLFSLVQVARWRGFEAEDALRQANRKFRRRYEILERLLRDRGLSMKTMSIEAIDQIWEEAKAETKS